MKRALFLILVISFLGMPARGEGTKSQVVQTSPKNDWHLMQEQEIQELNAKQYPVGEEWRRALDRSIYHWNNGQYHQAEYEVKQAIEEAQKAGKSDALGNLYSQLGACYRAQFRYDEALQAFQQSIDFLNKNPKPAQDDIALTLNNIGEIYRAQKQYALALPPLLQAKSILPEQQAFSAILMQNLGMVYVGLKQYPEAEASFKQAIAAALSPTSYNRTAALESMYSLSMLYSRLGRLSDLAPIVEKAVPLSIQTYGADDFHTKRLQEIQIAVQQAENNPTVQWRNFMDRGTSAMKANNYIQAATSFEKALKVVELTEPQSKGMAVTLANLGVAYLHANVPVKAEANFSKALILYKTSFAEETEQIKLIQRGLAIAKAKQQPLPRRKV